MTWGEERRRSHFRDTCQEDWDRRREGPRRQEVITKRFVPGSNFLLPYIWGVNERLTGRSNLPCACDWCHLTRSGPSVHDGTVFVRGRLIKITSNFVKAAFTLKLRTYRSMTITNQGRAQFYSPAITRHRGTHFIMAT